MNFTLPALLSLCFFSSFSTAQEMPKREKFSLMPVLAELGYNPRGVSPTPLMGESNDMSSAMMGVPKEVLQNTELPWPFRKFTASPSLNTIAVTLEPRAFPKIKHAHNHVYIIALPEGAVQRRPRLLKLLDRSPLFTASGVEYMTETLVRIQYDRVPELDPLALGQMNDYVFYDIQGLQIPFQLRDALPFGTYHIKYMRHLSDGTYIVAYSDSDRDIKAPLKFSIVDFDPLTRKTKIISTFTDYERGKTLLEFYDEAQENFLQSASTDGGLVGLSEMDQDKMDITLHRVVFDMEKLRNADVKNNLAARQCVNLLLSKINGARR